MFYDSFKFEIYFHYQLFAFPLYHLFSSAVNISPPSSINLRASASTIDVQWPATQDSVDGYNLKVTEGGSVVYKETLTPLDVSHSITGLTPGTDYTVSLTSYKGDATSPPIQQNIRTSECNSFQVAALG